jgi:hypothetical protein
MRQPISRTGGEPATRSVCSADLILLTPVKWPLIAPKQSRAKPVAATEICNAAVILCTSM